MIKEYMIRHRLDIGWKEKVEDLCVYDLYEYYTPIKKLSAVNQ